MSKKSDPLEIALYLLHEKYGYQFERAPKYNCKARDMVNAVKAAKERQERCYEDHGLAWKDGYEFCWHCGKQLERTDAE